MTKMLDVYKCNVCGNVVKVEHTGSESLVCCGQDMELLEEKTQDKGQEKHVPVITKLDNGVTVKVGDVEHPMEVKHYIEWIEIQTKDDQVYVQYLSPSDKPKAEFPIDIANVKLARDYCNIHGLWRK